MSVMVKVEISLDDSRLTIMYHEVWMASIFLFMMLNLDDLSGLIRLSSTFCTCTAEPTTAIK